MGSIRTTRASGTQLRRPGGSRIRRQLRPFHQTHHPLIHFHHHPRKCRFSKRSVPNSATRTRLVNIQLPTATTARATAITSGLPTSSSHTRISPAMVPRSSPVTAPHSSPVTVPLNHNTPPTVPRPPSRIAPHTRGRPTIHRRPFLRLLQEMPSFRQDGPLDSTRTSSRGIM
jgi:hypothetical protein